MTMFVFAIAALLCLTVTKASEDEFVCKTSGLFAHPTDCGKFILCEGDNEEEMKKLILPCGGGEGFLESEKRCLGKEYVQSCWNNKEWKGHSNTLRTRSQTQRNISWRDRTCSVNGFQCKNCKTLVDCLPGGIEVQVQNCSTGTYCNDNNKTCTNVCTYCDFQCSSQGIYPDLNDCHVFHYCSEDGHILTDRCPEGTVYNPETHLCGANVECLARPAPICQANAENAALISSANIYYICLQTGNALCPHLFHCFDGQIYDPDNGCIDSSSNKSSIDYFWNED